MISASSGCQKQIVMVTQEIGISEAEFPSRSAPSPKKAMDFSKVTWIFSQYLISILKNWQGVFIAKKKPHCPGRHDLRLQWLPRRFTSLRSFIVHCGSIRSIWKRHSHRTIELPLPRGICGRSTVFWTTKRVCRSPTSPHRNISCIRIFHPCLCTITHIWVFAGLQILLWSEWVGPKCGSRRSVQRYLQWARSAWQSNVHFHVHGDRWPNGRAFGLRVHSSTLVALGLLACFDHCRSWGSIYIIASRNIFARPRKGKDDEPSTGWWRISQSKCTIFSAENIYSAIFYATKGTYRFIHIFLPFGRLWNTVLVLPGLPDRLRR